MNIAPLTIDPVCLRVATHKMLLNRGNIAMHTCCCDVASAFLLGNVVRHVQKFTGWTCNTYVLRSVAYFPKYLANDAFNQKIEENKICLCCNFLSESDFYFQKLEKWYYQTGN